MESERNEDILLLTACIAPAASTLALNRADPQKRLEDYLWALTFYVGLMAQMNGTRLVFLENSGYPLGELEAVAEQAGVRERCEFVSFVSDADPKNNRYFLELHLLRTGYEQSSFLRQAGSETIWKITGRYLIENLASIIRTKPKSLDVYLNLRNVPSRELDFYVAGFSKRGFERIVYDDPAYYEGREAGEHHLRERLEDGLVGDMTFVPRLRRVPKIHGIRGFDGRPYEGGRQMLKYYMRAAAVRVAPTIWV